MAISNWFELTTFSLLFIAIPTFFLKFEFYIFFMIKPIKVTFCICTSKLTHLLYILFTCDWSMNQVSNQPHMDFHTLTLMCCNNKNSIMYIPWYTCGLSLLSHQRFAIKLLTCLKFPHQNFRLIMVSGEEIIVCFTLCYTLL